MWFSAWVRRRRRTDILNVNFVIRMIDVLSRACRLLASLMANESYRSSSRTRKFSRSIVVIQLPAEPGGLFQVTEGIPARLNSVPVAYPAIGFALTRSPRYGWRGTGNSPTFLDL